LSIITLRVHHDSSKFSEENFYSFLTTTPAEMVENLIMCVAKHTFSNHRDFSVLRQNSLTPHLGAFLQLRSKPGW
jgi:hypothetical protein